ncbi:hypothetical protein CPB86DRAFT_805394 [Serendipita vermifera]|nr:hypothetical protein CPB86DRAFT_805394 [Serendipita vermifera]
MSNFLSTVTRYFGPDDRLDIPGIVVQVINGVECQMIWAGTTNGAPQGETEQDIDTLVQQGRLGADWACSMTTKKESIPVAGTTLLKTTKDATAFPLSQRLAQRFKKQIFVSIDISPIHLVDGKSSTLTVAVERVIVSTLKSIEDTPVTSED